MAAFQHARKYTERHIAEAILRNDEEAEWRARRNLATVHIRYAETVATNGEWK